MTYGAIIHVTYEILKRKNLLNGCFTPDQIVKEYLKIKDDPIIKKLIQTFKKRRDKDRLKTMERISSYRRWLINHSIEEGIRPRYWVSKCNGGFKLLEESIKWLEEDLKRIGLNFLGNL